MTPRISLHLWQIVLPKATTTEDMNTFYVCNKPAVVLFIEFEVWTIICERMCDWVSVRCLYICECVFGAEVTILPHLEAAAGSPGLRPRHLADWVQRWRRYWLHACFLTLARKCLMFQHRDGLADLCKLCRSLLIFQCIKNPTQTRKLILFSLKLTE